MQVVIKSFSATVNLGIVKFKISRKAKEKKRKPSNHSKKSQ